METKLQNWEAEGDTYGHAEEVLSQVEQEYGITDWADNLADNISADDLELIARTLAYAIQGQHQIDNGRDFENNPV